MLKRLMQEAENFGWACAILITVLMVGLSIARGSEHQLVPQMVEARINNPEALDAMRAQADGFQVRVLADPKSTSTKIVADEKFGS